MRSSTMAVAALAVLAALLLSSSVHAQSMPDISSLFADLNVGSSGGGSSPKSAQDCRAGFASLGGIRNLQNDGGILSCASGYGGSCCSAVRRYLGPGSALDGCGCQPGLLTRRSVRSHPSRGPSSTGRSTPAESRPRRTEGAMHWAEGARACHPKQRPRVFFCSFAVKCNA